MTNNPENQRKRSVFIILQVLILLIFMVMFGRIVQLQILDYETYSPMSERNSIRQEIVNPARGLIFDRNGELIVSNEPSFSIMITPLSFDMETIPLLSELTGIDEAVIEERVIRARTYSRHRPSRLFTDVPFEVFTNIQENIWRLPGINHQVDGKRSYPSGARISHVLGYMAEISRDELAQQRDIYRMGDQVGRSGLERTYEPFLRGETGTQLVTVNAFGRSLGSYDQGRHDITPVKGADIVTTIDLELQKLAEKLMEGKTGGLVAMDPRSGGILAMVSAPDFDNSRISGRPDRDYWISVNTDSLSPLFNRSVSNLQPPGSTLKPIMGLIGMELGLITERTQIYCPGGYQRGRFYRCLRRHGNQTITQAIETSCNTFFYALMDQIVNRFGLNRWSQMLKDFGLGTMNNIDIPGERRGIVPDSAYYDRVFGVRRWGLGDMINLGIGQGTMGVSPLQMAVSTSALVNGGFRVQPHIVSEIGTDETGLEPTRPARHSIPWVQSSQLTAIHRGMERAVTDGSGRFYAKLEDVKVAGKTGTAQNPHGQNHGLFISYAPADDPEIVIAVLLENAGYGSISAAPVAGLMYEQYFLGEIRRQHVLNHVLNFKPAPYNPDRD